MLLGLARDVRFAVRTLLTSPGYAAVALVTVALGVGATTAVFSLVNGVLLRPLPYPESHELVRVWEQNASGSSMNAAWANFQDWRSSTSSFEGLAATTSGGPMTVLGAGEPVRPGVAGVSEGFFETLGVRPAVGRGFRPDEHRAGVEPVAVVSDAFWRTHFGGSRELGRVLNVAGFDVRVVGVAPPELDFPADVDLWFPLELMEPGPSRTAHNYRVVGRLAAGVTLEQADAELDALTAGFAEAAGEEAAELSDFFPVATRVETLRESIVGDTRRPLWILLGASTLLLLVACTNLAGTALARGTNRQRELAVRQALGAGRGRLVRQLFTESLVLAVPGAVLGLALAAGAVWLVGISAPTALPRLDAVTVDGPTLAFTAVAAVLAATMFGLIPGLRVADGRTAERLRAGRTGEPGSRRVWRGLVAAEVAVALVLLVGCGLLIRSFVTVLQVEPGFRTDDVLLVTVAPPAAGYPDGEARAPLYVELVAEIAAIPGVARVGLTAVPPLSGVANGQIQVRGRDDVTADYHLVDAGFFATLGIPLVAGRLFDPSDRPETGHVVVVNRAFAEMAWPGEDPLGRQITGGGMDDYWDQEKWATVVGVVEDVHHRSLTRDPEPAYYFSYRQRPYRSWDMTAVVVPERGDATVLAPAIRQAIRAADPDVPVSFQTMDQRVATAVADRRLTMTVLAVFALVALVLACVGIYGVVSYAVARRSREIGIRIALGADPASVRRLVQKDSVVGVGLGTAAGALLALALGRVLATLLFGVDPTDPVTFAAVLATLALAAWLAAYIPARRTTRLDPIDAIRAD